MKSAYRKAKKFKLDEDGEVVDDFTGTRKRPLPQWHNHNPYEQYGILYRYIHSRVGEHWNDVYSGAVSRAKTHGPYLEQWLLARIRDCVETRIKFEGVVMYSCNWRRGWRELQAGGLYIHPRTKALCRVPLTERHRYRNRAYNSYQDPNILKTVTVGEVEYKLTKQTYQRRIKCGVWVEVANEVWFKHQPYTYEWKENTWRKDDDGLYIYRVRTETRHKITTVSKKDIKKHNLNKQEEV